MLAELLYALGAALVAAGVAILLGPSRAPAGRWLWLAGAGAWCLGVMPALVVPPLPPGVETAGSIDARRATFLAAAGLGAAGCAGAAWVWRAGAWRSASAFGTRARLLAAAAPLVASAVLVAAALPDDRIVANVDAGMLRDFRLATLGSQMLFWATLGGAGAFVLRGLTIRRPRRGR